LKISNWKNLQPVEKNLQPVDHSSSKEPMEEEEQIENEKDKEQEQDRLSFVRLSFVASIMSSFLSSVEGTSLLRQEFSRQLKHYQSFKKYLEKNEKIIIEKSQVLENSGKDKILDEYCLEKIDPEKIQEIVDKRKIIQQCQAIIDCDKKIIESLKIFGKVLKSILIRIIAIQICLYFIIQLFLLFKECQDLLEKMKRFPTINKKIKNYFIFNRQIPDGFFNFSVSPLNIAISAEFSRYNTGNLFQTDHHVAQYQRTINIKENYFMSQKQKNGVIFMSIGIIKELVQNPSPQTLQTYKENIFHKFEVASWKKDSQKSTHSHNY
ncbi:hypothetical protein RFI_01034, partial [Reticulomyxa filosa]